VSLNQFRHLTTGYIQPKETKSNSRLSTAMLYPAAKRSIYDTFIKTLIFADPARLSACFRSDRRVFEKLSIKSGVPLSLSSLFLPIRSDNHGILSSDPIKSCVESQHLEEMEFDTSDCFKYENRSSQHGWENVLSQVVIISTLKRFVISMLRFRRETRN
jgi:hypothetical protein